MYIRLYYVVTIIYKICESVLYIGYTKCTVTHILLRNIQESTSFHFQGKKSINWANTDICCLFVAYLSVSKSFVNVLQFLKLFAISTPISQTVHAFMCMELCNDNSQVNLRANAYTKLFFMNNCFVSWHQFHYQSLLSIFTCLFHNLLISTVHLVLLDTYHVSSLFGIFVHPKCYELISF